MPRKKKILKKENVSQKKVIVIAKKEAQEKKPSVKILNRKWLGLIVLFIVFFGLGSFFYQNKGLLIAALVNNKPIVSFKLYQRLLKQYGKQTVDQLIVEELLFQEASRKKISVSTADIDQEIKQIEASLDKSTSLNELLSQQGMSWEDLRQRVKLQITARKLVEDKIAVSDEEVEKYIKDNKDYLPQDADEAKQKEDVRNYLKDQKINQEIQKLLQELRNSAKIATFL